jgi:hypothetical protein
MGSKEGTEKRLQLKVLRTIVHKFYEPLAFAYYMKEYLREIWKQPNKIEAGKCLDDWISGLQDIKRRE